MVEKEEREEEILIKSGKLLKTVGVDPTSEPGRLLRRVALQLVGDVDL